MEWRGDLHDGVVGGKCVGALVDTNNGHEAFGGDVVY
jgi:hypothetical protein